MKGNQMLDCPACAGPTALGGDCATCRGTTQISQEVYGAFMANQAIQAELFGLQTLINEALQSAANVDELKQAILNVLQAAIL